MNQAARSGREADKEHVSPDLMAGSVRRNTMFKMLKTGKNIIYSICIVDTNGLNYSVSYDTVDALNSALTMDMIRYNRHVTVTSEDLNRGLILDVICIK